MVFASHTPNTDLAYGITSDPKYTKKAFLNTEPGITHEHGIRTNPYTCKGGTQSVATCTHTVYK